MDQQAFLELLRQDSNQEESTDTDSNDSLRENRAHEPKKGEKNPYSNDELNNFINRLGFNTDEVPKFSEMARLVRPEIKQEVVKKDLTNLDNHDTIQDVAPSRNDLDVRKQALQRLIAKYKGQK